MLVTSIIPKKFIQSSCHSFLSKLLNNLRVSLALVETIWGVSHQLTSVVKTVLESPKLLTFIYLGQKVVKSHDDPDVTPSIIDELNSWIVREIKWKVKALMGNIFILAFLHILKKLSIRTNLFVLGILSISGM